MCLNPRASTCSTAEVVAARLSMSTQFCGSSGPVRPKQANGIPASASSLTRGSSCCSSESRKASTLRLAIRRRISSRGSPSGTTITML